MPEYFVYITANSTGKFCNFWKFLGKNSSCNFLKDHYPECKNCDGFQSGEVALLRNRGVNRWIWKNPYLIRVLTNTRQTINKITRCSVIWFLHVKKNF